MCLQNLFCSLEHVYLEGKGEKKNTKKQPCSFSVFTFWWLSSGTGNWINRWPSWKESGETPGCLYISWSQCIHANGPRPHSCAGFGGTWGDSTLWTWGLPPLQGVVLQGPPPRSTSLAESRAMGCLTVYRILTPDTWPRFHLLASGCGD